MLQTGDLQPGQDWDDNSDREHETSRHMFTSDHIHCNHVVLKSFPLNISSSFITTHKNCYIQNS